MARDAVRSEAVSNLERRRAEKKRAARRLWYIRVGVAAGTVAVIAGLVALVFYSPLFALKTENVMVEGTQSAESPDESRESILAAVAPWVDTPIARVPLGEMEKAVLEDATVSEVSISRSWPRGLLIRIEPRLPAMANKTETGYQILGSDGVVLSEVEETPAGLPAVQLSGSDSGEYSREASEVVVVWSAMSQGLKDQVALMKVNGADVSISLVSGSEVLWGNPENSEEKSQVLEVLLLQRPASIYDVMDPSRPSTR